MRILYAAMKYDYGKPEQGYSFEHYNFYDTLRNTNVDLLYFDFMSLLQQHGKRAMNKRLLEVVKSEKPDLLFAVLFTDEFDPKTIRQISTETDTITINWFTDDHWRFEDYSRHWAPCFNWVVTTANSALPKYQQIGYENAIKSQWACNHFSYKKLELPLLYDVTFVGQPHGNRRMVIEALRQAGITVHTWGRDWESGRVSQDQMINIFNQSRINLNLSNISLQHIPLWKRFVRRVPGARMIRQNLFPPKAPLPIDLDTLVLATPQDQIKGRNFEVPGCGGFLLTGMADALEEYYIPDQEVVCFHDTNSLIEKIHYYLKDETARRQVAENGYQRTLREHTYIHRFEEILQRIGLPMSLMTQAGTVQEIGI